MTRPTPAAAASLLVAGVLYLLARVTGGGWLALGAGAALALPVAAVLLRPRLAGLVVELDADRAPVGSSTRLQVRVRAGARATSAARLVLPEGLLGRCEVALPPLAAGEQVSGSVVLPALRRGTAQALPVVVSASSPFGLLRTARELPARAGLVVHPGVAAGSLQDAFGAGDGRPQGRAGAGTEVLGLRPWRTGDPRRAVHARSSARHGRPVVLEREREQGPRRVLLVGRLGRGAEWEAAVARAAATSLAALRSGGEPVLVGAAPLARLSPDAVLDWFAGLEAAGPTGPAEVARAVRAAGPGGTITVLGDPPAGLSGLRAVPA